VEDDEPVRRRLVAALVGAGHVVLDAGGVDEAVRLVRGSLLPLDAAVIDVVLPDGTGPALVERLARLGVVAPVVLISGHPAEAIHGATGCGALAVLQKPFSPAALLARLEELVDRRLAG
jgi:two-component system KDP operon response regulator KdpE